MAQVDVPDIEIRTNKDGFPAGRMWVDYCSDQLFRVYLNATGDTKPENALVEVLFDLKAFFTGPSVVVGYTAATWSQGDNHDIMSWEFRERCV